MTLGAVLANAADKKVTKALVVLCRLVVGAVFVFSGFVKGIDPWGSFYKFSEYFATFGMQGMENVALFGAFAVAVVEFVLGVSVLLGAFRRGGVLLTGMMMLVMLPLTLYLALTDVVPDCGCFGDAVVISNWATFWKNVVLTLMIAFLVPFNKKVPCVFGPAVQWIVAFVSFVFVLCVLMIGYNDQPLLDFRPFKVGSRLVARETGSDEADYIFVYEKGGLQKEFTIDSLPDDDWNYVDRRVKEPARPKTPSVAENMVSMYDDGEDVTEEVLTGKGQVLMLLFPDLPKVDIAYTFGINELCENATKQGVTVVGVTSAAAAEKEQWNDISMPAYKMLEMDDSQLKMIARGNPAVVCVTDGVIKWKRTFGSISQQEMQKRSFSLDDFDNSGWSKPVLGDMLLGYLGVLLVLLVVNRTHMVVKFSLKSLRRKRNKE